VCVPADRHVEQRNSDAPPVFIDHVFFGGEVFRRTVVNNRGDRSVWVREIMK